MGNFVAPHSGKYFDSINPATEERLAEIAEADAHDVDLAVKAARRAHRRVWSKLPGRERGKFLYRIARLLQENPASWQCSESIDGGKNNQREPRHRPSSGCGAFFTTRAGPTSWPTLFRVAFRKSLGVAGQIIPWNFPLLMAAWKLAPALAAGNTCVLKPAETTSITAMHLAEILQEAELPDGVVNIVTGAGVTGKALVDHPDVDKIAFTGSTSVGKILTRAVAGTKKKLTLELGRESREHYFRGCAD